MFNEKKPKFIFRYGTCNLKTMLIVGFLWSFAIAYTYAVLGMAVYGIFLLITLVYTYTLAFIRQPRIDRICLLIVGSVVCISLLNGILRLEIVDALRVNLSLILPLVVSTLKIEEIDTKEGWAVSSVVSMLVIFYLIQGKQMLSTGEVNENSIAFLGYMAVSLGFFWFKLSKNKIVPSIFLIGSFGLLVNAQCRNLILAFPLCMAALLIPQRLWEQKWFYRLFYVLAILYTINATGILREFFSSDLYMLVKEYINLYAEEKRGSMQLRVFFFEERIAKFAELPWYEKIWGRGIRGNTHCHNMYLQSLFIYGYFGTGLVYLFFVRVFEMGYTLIKDKKDIIALCCIITLWGSIILNGADLYLIGTDCVAIMPQIIMGIIMYRYRKYQQEGRNSYA